MGRVEHFSLCVDLMLNAGSRGTRRSGGSRRWPGASLHDDAGKDLEEKRKERRQTPMSVRIAGEAVGHRRARPRRMDRGSEGDDDERNTDCRQYWLAFVGPTPPADISCLSPARIHHTFAPRAVDRIHHL